MKSNRPSRMLLAFGPLVVLLGVAVSARAQRVLAPEATPAESQAVQQWAERGFGKPEAARPAAIPFSFTYDGVASAECLPRWEYSGQRTAIPAGWQQTGRYRDPKTGLVVSCELTVRTDAAAADWVLWLENQGTADTPIIENLLPLDCGSLLEAEPTGGEVLLRSSKGDNSWAESFLPQDEPLAPGDERSFASRSSNTGCFPFFNIKTPQEGWLLAVGWTGSWQASVRRSAQGQVGVRAGMQQTRFYLKPGERVRAPRIVLLYYQGPEIIRGHNQFRRMLLTHYVPRHDGKPIQPPVAMTNSAGLWLRVARGQQPAVARLTEATERQLIDRIAQLGAEAYWMDAYWMPVPYEDNRGNWYPRQDDFPNGMRPLADAAHQRGLDFILWFGTLRARPGSMMTDRFPDCFLDDNWLFRDPQACEKLTQWVLERQKEWQFDIYREDSVLEPAPADVPNRIGMEEMLQVEGFYRFWSEVLRRRPELVIDNCAGGGRRIDFETACRSYALWRSDFNDTGEGLKDRAYWPMMARSDQVMVSGLSLYYPLHTGPIWDMRPYCFRSAMTQGIVLYTDFDAPEFSDDQARAAIGELKGLRALFLGDLYPLLPLTMSQADWYAYQLDRPDLGQGCAFVFRRPENEDTAREIRLQHLDPEAEYEVTLTGESYAKGPTRSMRGRELMTLKVDIPEKPGSVLVEYHRAKP